MKKLFLIILLFILLRECFYHRNDPLLHLTVCDVGQGDAILLELAAMQILVDTGPDESVLTCLNSQLPFWDKKIDVLVLTHFDEDHIGGFAALSQTYSINYIFLPLTNYGDSDTFLELKERLSAMQELGTIIKEPFLGQQIAFYNFSPAYQAKYNSANYLSLHFLTPIALSQAEYSILEENKLFLWQKPEANLSAETWQELAYQLSDNDGSIVLFVQFGQLKVLLLGDLESTRELALVDHGLIDRVDIQKVGHHGSKTSSSLALLTKSRPEMALISCGLDNQFGHPSQEVLNNFQSINTQILRTDQLGNIEILSNGDQFWLKN